MRIGIIDFFTVQNWNANEDGPLPTVANGHMFCLDSSAFGPVQRRRLDQRHVRRSTTGPAVTEIVKDVAPDSDVYIATVGTVSDMLAAIDWFANSGVIDPHPIARLGLRRPG